MRSPSYGRELLTTLKATAGERGATLCLPVGESVQALLRPVATTKDSLNPEDVRVLTEWRNRHVEAFLTEFRADEERTSRWLTEMVGPDDTRILFMIDDLSGRTIGYVGLAFIDWEKKSGEADAVVSGGEAPRGTMTKALRVLLNWARVQLGLSDLGVRVRSDNTALEFYRKFGFRKVERIPLRKVEEEGMIRWMEDPSHPSSEPSLVHMTLPGAPGGGSR